MVTRGVEFVESVAEAVSLGLLVTTPDGQAVWSNQALRALLGVDPAIVGLAELPPLPPETVAAGREIAWTGPDGSRRLLGVTPRSLGKGTDGDGTPGLILYEFCDITLRHQYEKRTHHREWRLSRVEALAKFGTWEWDLETDSVEWSEELLGMFGYPTGAHLDYHDCRALVHPEDVGLVESVLIEALQTTGPFTSTHRMYLADRVTQRWFECYGEVITDESGHPIRVLGTAHDITEQRRIQEELEYLAEHDPLTSLPNRRSIAAHLRERLDCYAPSGALLLVDIDHFRDINDLRGHMVGDTVLRSLPPLLAKWSDPRALLGRLSGDEFAIVLPDGDAASTLAAAESLCDAVARHPFVAEGAALRITVSIGAAPLAPARDSEVLLANADLALHEAKRAGRSRARLLAPEQ